MSANCTTNIKGMGAPCEIGTPIGTTNALILLKSGYTFADASAIATLATVKTAIADKNIMVVRDVVNVEDIKVEDDVEDTGFETIFNSYGVRGNNFMLNLTKDQHKIFFEEYNGKKWDVIEITRNGYLKCIKNSDGTIGGYPTGLFRVKQSTDPAAGVAVKTPLMIQHEDATIWDKLGFVIQPTYGVNKIQPITQVTLSDVGTVVTNAFDVTVSYTPTQTAAGDGTATEIAISGLGTADFQLLDADGTVNVISDVTESTTASGTYTITGTTFTGGSVKVIPNTSNADLYESASSAVSA